jgi:hypothetical protein
MSQVFLVVIDNLGIYVYRRKQINITYVLKENFGKTSFMSI